MNDWNKFEFERIFTRRCYYLLTKLSNIVEHWWWRISSLIFQIIRFFIQIKYCVGLILRTIENIIMVICNIINFIGIKLQNSTANIWHCIYFFCIRIIITLKHFLKWKMRLFSVAVCSHSPHLRILIENGNEMWFWCGLKSNVITIPHSKT